MIQTIIAKGSFARVSALLIRQYDSLADTGSFFAVVATEYDAAGNVLHDFFDVIHAAVSLGYGYINTIVYPTRDVQDVCFYDNVRYVVWLCKKRAAMTFHKDVIREKHIWKDVEWGKRAKNYNPKGKDPGNVWIPTEDDGKGHITRHHLRSDQEVIRQLAAMTGGMEHCMVIDEPLAAAHLSTPVQPEQAVPLPTRPKGTVVFGSSEQMEKVSDGSVQVAVTSPPYWDLKDYFKEGQIGQEPYAVYLQRMEAVWRQCHQKLRPSGSLWVNVNIRSRGGQVILLPRDLIGLCRKIGFYYKGILIWHKSSGIPTNEKNIVDRHEYVLLFTKEKRFTVKKTVQASFADYKNDAINGGAFWNINRKAGSVGKKYIHPAIYPDELVKRILRCAAQTGDLVVDPFLGSGTSLIAALQCGCDFIGYEYNEAFAQLMCSRFAQDVPDADVIFLTP